MKSLKFEKLELKAEKSLGNITISWLGRSDASNPPEFLVPYFTEIMPDIKGNKLTVDFKKLEFMNSSTVSGIIKFVRMVFAEKVEARFVYDKSVAWQVTSFKALETICIPMKTIKVEGV